MNITKGDILRWFNIDWENVNDLGNATEHHHEQIFDALLDLPNAKEVNSGHTGYNVAFANADRSDIEIKRQIRAAVEKVLNTTT